MSIMPNTDTLTNYDLCQIFSYLDLSDMPQVACVCRRWRDILRSTDEIWMSFCQNRLREAHPHRGLCRDRCKLIRNWKSGSAVVTNFSPSVWRGDEIHAMTILDDNTAWEVLPDRLGSQCFIVRDLEGMSPPIRIDLKEHGCERIVASLLKERSWFVLDQKGNVFIFEILTGGCISKILENNPVGGNSISKIFLNEREIIVVYNEKIIIYDRATNACLLRLGVKKIENFFAVVSTPRFIIVSSKNSLNYKIHKETLITELLENVFSFRCIGSQGPYCVFLSPYGQIEVYEDDPDRGLVALRALEASSPSCFMPDQVAYAMCNNWLAVSNFGKLHVWDFVTGKEISKMNLPRGHSRFCINGDCLLTRGLFDRLSGYPEFSYRLFDFTRDKKSLGVSIHFWSILPDVSRILSSIRI